MADSEKELKKGIQLVFDPDKEYVSADDFIKAVDVVTDLLKKYIDSNLRESKTDTTGQVKKVLKSLEDIETKLSASAAYNKETSQSEIRTITRLVMDESKRLEALIPNVADLSPLEEKINRAVIDLEAKIPNLPEELSPEGIRDKLETLEGIDRIDKKAIRGITVSSVPPSNPEVNDLWIRT